jgi:hypothetical protein
MAKFYIVDSVQPPRVARDATVSPRNVPWGVATMHASRIQLVVTNKSVYLAGRSFTLAKILVYH